MPIKNLYCQYPTYAALRKEAQMLGFLSFTTPIFHSRKLDRPQRGRTRGALLVLLLLLGFAHTTSPLKAESLASFAARTHLDKETLKTHQKGEKIVIDQNILSHLASRGRIAGVAKPKAESAPIASPKPGLRQAWRSQYSKAAAKILKVDEKVRSVREKIKALEARIAASRSAQTRFRLGTEIEVQQSRVESLLRERERLRNGLNHVVRLARKDGAQPGWFRDLAHP